MPEMDVATIPTALSYAKVRGRYHRGKGDVDGRSSAAKRFHRLASDTIADLGGIAVLTAAELSMVRQAAAITVRSEQLQKAILRGEPIDHDELIRLSSESRRILMALARRRDARQQRAAVGLELRPIPMAAPAPARGLSPVRVSRPGKGKPRRAQNNAPRATPRAAGVTGVSNTPVREGE